MASEALAGAPTETAPGPSSEQLRAEAGTPAWRPRVLSLLLVFSGLVAYHNALDGVFLFDDHPWIVENEDLETLWPPTVAMGDSFRPLLFYSLALNRAWSGLETWSYHVVDIALHLLSTLLVFGVIRRTFRLPSLSRIASPELTAFVIAALWTVHPLNSQTVNYIIQRGEGLMALFYLATLYGFLRSVTSKRPGLWGCFAVASFYVGLGSKEVIVTAPVVMFLMDAVLVEDSWRTALRKRAALYGALVGPLFVAPLYWLVTNPERFALVRPSAETPPALDYAAAQSRVILEYLTLSFRPGDLCLDHYWQPGAHTRTLNLSTLLVGALIVTIGWALRRRSPLGVLGAAFFLILAPTSSVMPIRDYLVEHRMYLPLIPWLTLLVVGAIRLGRTLLSSTLRTVAGGLAFLTLVSLILPATWSRNALYRGRIPMWTDVIEKSPENPRAHFNLGLGYLDLGEPDDLRLAYEHFSQAVRYKPDHVKALNNLGSLQFGWGHLDEAEAYYQRVLAMDDEKPQVLANLGSIFVARKDDRTAVEYFRRALGVYEEAGLLHNNLGAALYRLGQFDDAARHFLRATELDPRRVEGWLNLAKIRFEQRRWVDAIDAYRRLVDLEPDRAAHHYHLGRSLAANQEPDAAVTSLLEAARLEPRAPDVHRTLGELFLELRQLDDAERELRLLLELVPDDAEGKRLLEVVRRLRRIP